MWLSHRGFFFFFNDTGTSEIYTSFPTRRSSDLHRIAPQFVVVIEILVAQRQPEHALRDQVQQQMFDLPGVAVDRKSTRLNSSHRCISYAVFCLKKKKQHRITVMTCDTARSQEDLLACLMTL